MPDQADGLRALVRARSGSAPGAAPAGPGADSGPDSESFGPKPRCRSIVLTSGKGGVGTSVLALNLAIALGEHGRRVVLVDADLGLANIDLLCGLAPAFDLGDVLAGSCRLADAIVEGPGGIRVVPGAHASRTLMEVLADGPDRLLIELAGLEAGADVLVVDAGSGLGRSVAALASAGDEVVVVATPEPTAVADAHAAIGRLRRLPSAPTIRAVVNQAASGREGLDVLRRLAASSRQFQGAVVDPLGSVRADPAVPASVRAQRPFAAGGASGAAARDVRALARALLARAEPSTRPARPGFFAALAARRALARAAAGGGLFPFFKTAPGPGHWGGDGREVG